MKLITFVIPSYNSERYLASCLDSLLVGLDNEIEVIVVNDGSKDDTSKIAHEYADKYDFIRVIDKENGGHGSGINVGIEQAQGLFLKILDSDDHVDKEGLLRIVEIIGKHLNEGKTADLYLADYWSVPDSGDKRVITSHRKWVKELNIVSDYSNFKRVPESKYFMTHELFVKVSVLRENNVRLIEKCFYEDTKYTLDVFLYCKSFCYVDKPVYLYTVGRDGQSVSIDTVDKKYTYQVTVVNETIKSLSTNFIESLEKHQKRIAMHELNTMFYLTFFFLHVRHRKEKADAYKQLSKFFKEKEPKLYKRVYHHSLLFWFNLLPPFLRGPMTDLVYKLLGKKSGWR